MPITLDQYQYSLTRAIEGGKPSVDWNYAIDRGSIEGFYNADTALLPFGRAVRFDTDGRGILPLSATGQTVVGVSLYTNTYEKELDNSAGYPINREVGIRTKGLIYMILEVDMTKGDALFVRHTANVAPAAFDGIGRVRNDADSANADAFTGATLLQSGIAGDAALIFLDLPVVVA